MKTSFFEMFEGSSPQLLAVITGTINAISDGMMFGWTAPTLPILRSKDTPVVINHSNEVWLETLTMIGGLMGLPFSIYLINSLGRKTTMWLSSIVGICGWISIAAGNNVYYLYVGRILLGMTGNIAFTASPIYISEIAHQKIRGFLAGLIYLMMLAGIIVVYSVAPWVPIYVTSLVGISVLMVQLILFPFMPESPYYYIYVNKLDEAEKSLKRLRVEKDVSAELEDIKKAVERQKTERGRPQDLIKIKSNRKGVIIIVMLNFTQHFAGVAVLIMNLHSILEEAGSNFLSPQVSAVVFPCLMLLSAGTATLIIDDCGRKILLSISGFFTTVSLLMLAVYLHLKYLGFPTEQYNWIPLLSVIIYALSVKFGLSIVPIVITAELFPAKVKGMGLAIGDGASLGASFLSIYCYQWWNDLFGIHVSFYIFAVICAVCSVWMHFYIPETKGKTLEEIQMILKNKHIAPKREDQNGACDDSNVQA